MASHEEIISAVYRGLLRRDADEGGLALYSNELRDGGELASILDRFVNSPEFRNRIQPEAGTASPYALDDAPPMPVQTSYTPDESRRLWHHIASVWSGFGETDPFYSVLTDDRWRMEKMSDEDALSAFYETGQLDARRMEIWLARSFITPRPDAVVAELGCGVGRITRFLARRFGRVIAADISQPHLDAAKRRLDGEGLTNVDFRLLRDAGDLGAFSDVDIFFSIIVLQHNPPPIMLDILASAFAGLRSGGIAFFQIPTYSKEYSFSTESYFASLAQENTMEMHFLPQRAIFELARRHNLVALEVQPDWCIGHPEMWISNTFLFRKADAA
jgi:SAM-dependent methyltransferase